VYRNDTIAARATAAGRAAVAILRVSGPEAFSIADRVLQAGRAPRGSVLEPWRLVHGRAVDPADGSPVDEVLFVRMPGPKSYTCEDVVEIHCHGAPVVVDRLLGVLLREGARAAEPGEFTRRAVLNGRMDLLQAEAVADLIEARGSASVRAAWEQLQGALSSRLVEIRADLVAVLADVEANVDFSDDDLPSENRSARRDSLIAAAESLAALAGGFEMARRRREGLAVVFAGRPNVGKSSLVNALLGQERMIVTDEAGTTRDAVEETIEIGGVPLILTDTAGLRESPSRAEELAVARAKDKAGAADILVRVVDGSRQLDREERTWLAASTDATATITVVNKSDLAAAVTVADISPLTEDGMPVLATAASTGAGCDRLRSELADAASRLSGADAAQPVSISRSRHLAAVERTRGAIEEACRLLDADGAAELVALELRTALAELAGITDPVDNEEILDRIFGEFCIGK
jgi:tRNA modification GTPase